MSLEFDRLLAAGQFTDAVRHLAGEMFWSGKTGYTRKQVLEQLADKVDSLSAENEKLRSQQEAVEQLRSEICKHHKASTCKKYKYCLAHKGPVSTCPERSEGGSD